MSGETERTELEHADLYRDQTREEFSYTIRLTKESEPSAQDAVELIREILADEIPDLKPDNPEYPMGRIDYVRSRADREISHYRQILNRSGVKVASQVFERMSTLARVTSLVRVGKELNTLAESLGFPLQCDLMELTRTDQAQVFLRINRLARQHEILQRTLGTGTASKGPAGQLLGPRPTEATITQIGTQAVPPLEPVSEAPSHETTHPVQKLSVSMRPIEILDDSGDVSHVPFARRMVRGSKGREKLQLPDSGRKPAVRELQPSEVPARGKSFLGKLFRRGSEATVSVPSQVSARAEKPEEKEVLGVSQVGGHPGQIEGESYRGRGEDAQVHGYSKDNTVYHASIDGMGGHGYGDKVAGFLSGSLDERLKKLGEGERFDSVEAAQAFYVQELLNEIINANVDLRDRFDSISEMHESGATLAIAKEFRVRDRKFCVILSVDDAMAAVISGKDFSVKGYVSTTDSLAQAFADEGLFQTWAIWRHGVENPLTVGKLLDKNKIKWKVLELDPGDMVFTCSDGIGDTLTIPDKNRDPNVELYPFIQVLKQIPEEERTPDRIIHTVHEKTRMLQGTVPGKLQKNAPNYKKPVWFDDLTKEATWEDVGIRKGKVVVPGKADDVAITVSIA